MLEDQSSCRTSVQSLSGRRFSGLQRLLVALQGLSWREQPEDADQRQTDSARRRGARRGVVTDKPTFSSISFPISTASAKISAASKLIRYERVVTRV